MLVDYSKNKFFVERFQKPLGIFFILILFMLICTTSRAQSKRDFVWITGNAPAPNFGSNGFIYDFNGMDSIMEYYPVGFQFDLTNGSICDNDGNLLFYSNGCEVANINHDTMPNGTGINEGDYIDVWLDGDCRYGYTSIEGIMAFPDPANNDGYYLITKPVIYEEGIAPFFRDLQFSYVDMSLDNGLGDVTIKNNIFYSEGLLSESRLNGIKHGSENKYWIIQITAEPRAALFLLDSTGVHFSHYEDIEPWIDVLDSGPGNSNFSPDGSMFAFSNNFQGVFLYDFDRETGSLSNFRHAAIPSTIGFAGVEFSPSSEFLYLSVSDSLWQMEVKYDDLLEGAELIATWDGVWDPWPYSFGYAKLGPDCRIYITAEGSADAWHFIKNPDLKGQACDFRFKGSQFPYHNTRGNLPHQPKFRVDEDEKCNPDINTMFGELVYYTRPLVISPNPTEDLIKVSVPEASLGELYIIDLHGKEVLKQRISIPTDELELSLAFLKAGVYVVEFIPTNNAERIIYSEKLVVVD